MKKIVMFLMVTITLIFSGCSSVNTLISKRNLDVQTKLSETIWLDPELINDKTIFVQIKNTSTQNLDIETAIKNNLISKGYRITSNPKSANYWLQVNVLKLSKYDLRKGNPFESGILGAGVGAILGAYNTGSANTAVGLGLAGGVAAAALDALVEDVGYMMVTDLLISEKAPNRVITNNNLGVVTQGTGKVISTSTTKTNMNKYQTRILSLANKVNLKFEEARPVLETELINVISNIF